MQGGSPCQSVEGSRKFTPQEHGGRRQRLLPPRRRYGLGVDLGDTLARLRKLLSDPLSVKLSVVTHRETVPVWSVGYGRFALWMSGSPPFSLFSLFCLVTFANPT